MLFVSTRTFYNEKNQFELKEIYVSDGAVTYILRKTEGFIPVAYNLGLMDMHEAAKGLLFSNLGFGVIRQYNDTDAKSLANYLRDKITGVNMKAKNAEKTLYEVLSTFGEDYA